MLEAFVSALVPCSRLEAPMDVHTVCTSFGASIGDDEHTTQTRRHILEVTQ